MGKKFVIEGLGEVCPLCIEPQDGRGKERRPPVFLVSCEGGYCGAVCAPHLSALIKATDGSKAEVRPEVKPKEEPKPNGVPVAAVPVQK
jgi:hypothetical protein